jgi:hypothetical protein
LPIPPGIRWKPRMEYWAITRSWNSKHAEPRGRPAPGAGSHPHAALQHERLFLGHRS